MQYSLSECSKKDFQATCHHLHNQTHDRCDDLKAILDEIKSEVQHSQFSNEDEKDNAMYVVLEACNHIAAWKSHQLRTINQEKAKHDAMSALDEQTVLITQDWAMKFLPQHYRESQGNWFAKRGMSWHLSYVTTKKEGSLQSQCFIHIIDKCKQESSIVVPIMENVLAQLKAENPDINKAYYRSDNAGCYHSINTVLSCPTISKRTGIHIHRYDFSDPQGGKGPCDRYSAIVKSHVRIYLNEGHDIVTPKDFKEAMESHHGIPGVRVTLVEEDICDPGIDNKYEGISSLNNFLYNEKGIRAWQAFSIGKGQFLPWSNFKGKDILKTREAIIVSSDMSVIIKLFISIKSFFIAQAELLQ